VDGPIPDVRNVTKEKDDAFRDTRVSEIGVFDSKTLKNGHLIPV